MDDSKLTTGLARCVVLVFAAAALAACAKEKNQSPEPDAPAQVYEAQTDADGVANLADGSDQIVFTAVAVDSSGAPMPGLEVTYFGSTPDPLVAFNESATGDPVGTFAVTPETSGAKRADASEGASGSVDVGVFILDMLDIGGGRLYDPARDGFQPVLPNTLKEIRSRLSYEEVELILSATPGIQDLHEYKLRDLPVLPGVMDDHMFDVYDYSVTPEERMAVHRYLRLSSWTAGRPPSYMAHVWTLPPDDRRCFIPLGARVVPIIDAPQNGHTFADDAQRVVEVTGRLAEEPVYLTADGGHVEIYANGAILAGALTVGGDGSGGTVFSIPGGLQLVPGENRLEVVAYMGEAGWGFATPASGEVGRSSVTVTYQPPEVSPVPVLSGLSYSNSTPGPDGDVPFTFHFKDSDADIDLFHWKGNGVINGESASGEFEHPITQVPELSSMVGSAEGDCTLHFRYGGVDLGGWYNIELWVLDALGNSSNHLTAHITILPSPGSPVPDGATWTLFMSGGDHQSINGRD